MQITKWFRDSDGVWSIWKDPDSTKTYKDDISRYLGKTSAGAQITISSATFAADGITLVSSSNTTTVLTMKVTQTGELTATVTDSEGDIHKLTYRWKKRDRGT